MMRMMTSIVSFCHCFLAQLPEIYKQHPVNCCAGTVCSATHRLSEAPQLRAAQDCKGDTNWLSNTVDKHFHIPYCLCGVPLAARRCIGEVRIGVWTLQFTVATVSPRQSQAIAAAMYAAINLGWFCIGFEVAANSVRHCKRNSWSDSTIHRAVVGSPPWNAPRTAPPMAVLPARAPTLHGKPTLIPHFLLFPSTFKPVAVEDPQGCAWEPVTR